MDQWNCCNQGESQRKQGTELFPRTAEPTSKGVKTHSCSYYLFYKILQLSPNTIYLPKMAACRIGWA